MNCATAVTNRDESRRFGLPAGRRIGAPPAYVRYKIFLQVGRVREDRAAAGSVYTAPVSSRSNGATVLVYSPVEEPVATKG